MVLNNDMAFLYIVMKTQGNRQSKELSMRGVLINQKYNLILVSVSRNLCLFT